MGVVSGNMDIKDLKFKPERFEELWFKCKEQGSLTGLDFLEYTFLVKFCNE